MAFPMFMDDLSIGAYHEAGVEIMARPFVLLRMHAAYNVKIILLCFLTQPVGFFSGYCTRHSYEVLACPGYALTISSGVILIALEKELGKGYQVFLAKRSPYSAVYQLKGVIHVLLNYGFHSIRVFYMYTFDVALDWRHTYDF